MPARLSDVPFNDGAAKVIKNVLSGDWRSNAQIQYGRHSSDVDPGQHYAGKAEPQASLVTSDLLTVLGLSLLTGAKVTAGITLPFRKRDDCGAFVSGSNHTASTCTAGLLVIDSIEASQLGESDEQPGATANLTFHAKGNGTDPISIATSQSIAAEAFGSQFSLGPTYINSTLVTGVQSIRWEPRLTVTARWRDGLIYPQELYIERRRPMVTITIDDIEQFATSGGFGPSFSAITTVTSYLRRRKDQTTHEADAALAHGSISFGAGISKTEQIAFQDNADGTGTLQICAAGLTSATGVAIP